MPEEINLSQHALRAAADRVVAANDECNRLLRELRDALVLKERDHAAALAELDRRHNERHSERGAAHAEALAGKDAGIEALRRRVAELLAEAPPPVVRAYTD